MDVERWDIVAANNTEAPPDGAPENMLRSGLNNCIREVMAATARWHRSPEFQNRVYGYTVSKYGPRVVQISNADVRSAFPAGMRIRVWIGSSAAYYGYVVSASKPGAHTLVTVNIDPNLGYGELASGIQLTFADADPDTITAASGTPFSSLVDGDRVRVRLSTLNSGIYEIDGATGSVITLASGESLSAEGPVSAKIYQESGTIPDGIDKIECACAFHGTAATRDVGDGDGELLSMGYLESHVQKPEGSGGGIDADKLDGKHATDIETYLMNLRNLLVNGDFVRWQEGDAWSAVNDDTYVADQWVLLSDGNGVVDVDKLTTDLPDDVDAGIVLTWLAGGVNKKAALYQMVENHECLDVLGGSGVVSVSLRLKGSTGGNPEDVRVAVIAWNGTADAPTADPVSAWPAADANPTLKSSFTIEGYEEFTLTGAWQTYTLENVAIDYSSAKNVGILIWSDDDTLAAGNVMQVCRVRMVKGATASDLPNEPLPTLYARTWRYFWKTFPESISPGHNKNDNYALHWCSVGSSGRNVVFVHLPTVMHSSPTLAFYNPENSSPGSSYVRNDTDNTDYAVSASYASTHFFRVESANPGDNDHLMLHVTADARFF